MSRHFLKSEITASQEMVESLRKSILSDIEEREKARAIDKLEANIRALATTIRLENDAAPREYIGKIYTKMISHDIEKLESIERSLISDEESKKIDHLLHEGNLLLEEIDFNY